MSIHKMIWNTEFFFTSQLYLRKHKEFLTQIKERKIGKRKNKSSTTQYRKEMKQQDKNNYRDIPSVSIYKQKLRFRYIE